MKRPMSVTTGTKRKEGGVGETVRVVIHALLIALVIRTFLFQPFNIPSGSMKATLLVGDYLFVSKYSYGYSKYSLPLSPPIISGRVPGGMTPERGDVVVFRLPKDPSVDYIKRVIGLPGDKVEVRDDGKVYVNGVALEEPYTYKNDAGVNEPTVPLTDQTSWVIPPGELFVMGDHRQKSADSRAFGPIPESSIVGRAFLRYWPLSTIGIIQTPSYPGVPDAAP